MVNSTHYGFYFRLSAFRLFLTQGNCTTTSAYSKLTPVTLFGFPNKRLLLNAYYMKTLHPFFEHGSVPFVLWRVDINNQLDQIDQIRLSRGSRGNIHDIRVQIKVCSLLETPYSALNWFFCFVVSYQFKTVVYRTDTHKINTLPGCLLDCSTFSTTERR